MALSLGRRINLLQRTFSPQLLNYSSQRWLSVSETAIALRPLFFKVHPDLFGKFPKEQAINEQSLKLLNEYIERLHSRQDVQPVSLIFYMRNNSSSYARNLQTLQHSSSEGAFDNFHSVQLILASKTLRDAVRSILGACSLSMDYVDSLKPSKAKSQLSNIQVTTDEGSPLWQAVVNAMFDRHNKHRRFDFFSSEFQPNRLSKDTLVEWLRKNIIKAHKRNLVALPVRQDIRRLKELLQDQMGVADVQWESNWAQASFRTALRGLLRICSAHADKIHLQGRTVIFGNDTGVCIRGNVVLRYDSVPESWISILTSLHKHNGALHRIPSVEKYLSALLNDINIVSRSYLPVVRAEDYLHQLLKLVASIQDQQTKETGGKLGIHTNLDGVELVIECATGPLMISQSGQILVPSSCPVFLIVDFINTNAAKAKLTCEQFKRSEKEQWDIVSRCHTELGLESLTSDSNVTRQQMTSCCTRLLQLSDMKALDVDLTSCHLRITHFYSVMSEGDICIPWNFENFV